MQTAVCFRPRELFYRSAKQLWNRLDTCAIFHFTRILAESVTNDEITDTRDSQKMFSNQKESALIAEKAVVESADSK